MGISKSELLAGDDGNAAVKLALAETTVIAETKKYFEDAGIVLESLSPRVPRSQTVILVKNIPYGTTVHTLTDLFSPHGDLKRILLPPSGTLGVVEFTHSHEAGKAFKAVAYRRLGNAVLYLEKGPEGMFKDPNVPSLKEKAAEEKRLLAEKVAEAAATAASSRDQPDPTDEAGSTLFLKNLSFATTSDRLASVLSSLAGFSFARVQTKPDPKREGARLSMGYGFVGFKTKDAAQRALGGLQGFEIDGYKIEAKFAQRGAEEVDKEQNKGEPIKGKNKGTKVLVKNLPFEATKKDVRELFRWVSASRASGCESARAALPPIISFPDFPISHRFNFTSHRFNSTVPTLALSPPYAHIPLVSFTNPPAAPMASSNPSDCPRRPPSHPPAPREPAASPSWNSPPTPKPSARWTRSSTPISSAGISSWSGRRRGRGSTSMPCGRRWAGIGGWRVLWEGCWGRGSWISRRVRTRSWTGWRSDTSTYSLWLLYPYTISAFAHPYFSWRHQSLCTISTPIWSGNPGAF
jgi:RNA recognition motif-containing protein